MAPILTAERACEAHRDRPVRRLRRADGSADGRGLGRHCRTAPGCKPLWPIALRLAPHFVRFAIYMIILSSMTLIAARATQLLDSDAHLGELTG
jgi:hypothetical protein